MWSILEEHCAWHTRTERSSDQGRGGLLAMARQRIISKFMSESPLLQPGAFVFVMDSTAHVHPAPRTFSHYSNPFSRQEVLPIDSCSTFIPFLFSRLAFWRPARRSSSNWSRLPFSF